MNIRLCRSGLLVLGLSLSIGSLTAAEQAAVPDDPPGQLILVRRVSGILHFTGPDRRVNIVTRHDDVFPAIPFGSRISAKKGSAIVSVNDDLFIKLLRRQEILIQRNPHDHTVFIAASPALPGSVVVEIGVSRIILHADSTVNISTDGWPWNTVKSFQGRVSVMGPDHTEIPLLTVPHS